jgi:hypothetical protein
MAFAASSTYFDIGDSSILGCFTEKDYGNLFEFSVNDEPDYYVKREDYPHKVWVGDGWRYGRVLKTVAYIVVDENADGSPEVEKWETKNYNSYKAAL